MVDTWVVVADGSTARIFSTDAEMAELTEVKELSNKHHAPEHRRRDAGGGHHAEETRFAQDLAQLISAAVTAREVRDVVLVAPARFLGDLEGSMPRNALAHVTAKVGRDFTRYERHELGRRVKAALAGQTLDDAH